MAVVKNADDLGELSEQELEELYTWIDGIPLTRPKRNIARDFADGVLIAEVVKHENPKLVDVHNYTSSSSTQQKMQNWFLLNRKVFKKLRFELSEDVIRRIVNAQVGVVENVLQTLRTRLERVAWETKQLAPVRAVENDRPEADQNIYQKHERRAPAPALAKEKAPSQEKGYRTASPYSQELMLAKLEAPAEYTLDRSRRRGGDSSSESSTLTGLSKFGTPRGKGGDSVPNILLEEKAQEVLAKDETIMILQAKIKRLEHLLHLKDIRIEDLQSRLEATRPTGKR